MFYCPGNHELWGHAEEDSLQRLHGLLALCRRLGVEVAPGEAWGGGGPGGAAGAGGRETCPGGAHHVLAPATVGFRAGDHRRVGAMT